MTTSTAQLAALIYADAQRFEALKQEITQLDYFCKGSLLKRMMKCGQKQCACHRDPAKRHGPYFECTYKLRNKTVNVRLPPEVVPLYRAAIQQQRKFKSVMRRMEQLSRSALAHLAQQKLMHSD